MKNFEFICAHHQNWARQNPLIAISQLNKMYKTAQQMLHGQQYATALSHIGTAYETAYLLFEQESESPQLAIMLTSLAIMLSDIYVKTGEHNKANQLLMTLQRKLNAVIQEVKGQCSRVVFLKHCFCSLTEARNDMFCSYEVVCPQHTNTLH